AISSAPISAGVASGRRFVRNRSIWAAEPCPLLRVETPPRFFQRSLRSTPPYGPLADRHHQSPPSSVHQAGAARPPLPEVRKDGAAFLRPVRPRFAPRFPADARAPFRGWSTRPPAALLSASRPPSQRESARPTSSPDKAIPDWYACLAKRPSAGTSWGLPVGTSIDSSVDSAPGSDRTPSSLYSSLFLCCDTADRNAGSFAGI